VPHAPHFFRRSIIQQLEVRAEEEFKATSSHKFRSFSDLHVAYLFAHYLLESAESHLARVVETSENYPDLSKPTYTVYLFNGQGQPTAFYGQLDTLRLAKQRGGALPKFISVNDALDDGGSAEIERYVRDTLLALYPEPSEHERDAAQLGELPNTDPAAACPPAARTAGRDSCPELWQPDGICVALEPDAACAYDVGGRELRCRCCYPARLTWQCEFEDGGPALDEEPEHVVSPELYVVKTSWRGRSNRGLDSEAPNVWSGAPRAGGPRMFLTPPEHLLTFFHTIVIVEFGDHLPTLPLF
jgi:hypothetical protein